MTVPLPVNEDTRLARLRAFGILDTPPELAFDCITRLAAAVLDTPIAAISLIDERRQWFKSRVGLEATETPRDVAFCTHAILSNEVLVVSDALKNDAFCKNPLVTGELGIRFYAGAPLTTRDGLNIGRVCVIDQKPRKPTPEQLERLKDLAVLAVDELELRIAGRATLDEVDRQKRLDEAKSAFVSDVSHELRTPPTSILGSVGFLLSDVTGEVSDRVR